MDFKGPKYLRFIVGVGATFSPKDLHPTQPKSYEQIMASKRTVMERQKTANAASGLNAATQAAALTNQVGGGNIGFTYE